MNNDPLSKKYECNPHKNIHLISKIKKTFCSKENFHIFPHLLVILFMKIKKKRETRRWNEKKVNDDVDFK